jgi:putative phosphoesterase
MLVPSDPLGKRRLERLHSTIMRPVRARPRRARRATVVGVISDTHGLLRPEAVAALTGVDLIVHGGDIGSAAILDELGKIAPVLAVRGNNDREPWAASIPDVVTTSVAGVRLCVVHELKRLKGDRTGGADVVISGHSHRPSVERGPGGLWLNPGSAGPRRFTLPISVARLHLGAGGARAEIVELDVAGGPLRRPRGQRRRGLDGAHGTGAVSVR